MSLLVNLIAWNVLIATALALLVWLAGRARPLRERPALRHCLWLAVLCKLVIPPLIPLPLLPHRTGGPDSVASHWLNPQGANPLVPFTRSAGRLTDAPSNLQRSSIEPAQIIAASQEPDPAAGPLAWGALQCLVWISLFVTIVILVRTGVSIGKLNGLLRRADRGQAWLDRLVQREARRLGIVRCPQVCVVRARLTPHLWCFRPGPLIVLPAQLVDRFDQSQIICVLRHELAHYARRDHWTNLIAYVVVALFWWNPIAWWARRELKVAQESACDALALQKNPEMRQAYASTLLDVIDFIDRDRWQLPQLASGLGESTSIQRRFEMIANERVRPRVTVAPRILLVCIALGVCCYPVVAQTQTEPSSVSIALMSDAAVALTQSADQPKQETSRPKAEVAIASAPGDPQEYTLAITIERFRLPELPRLLSDLSSSGKFSIAIVRVKPSADESTSESDVSWVNVESEPLSRRSVGPVLRQLDKRLAISSLVVQWPALADQRANLLDLLFDDFRARWYSEMADTVQAAVPNENTAVSDENLGWEIKLHGIHYYDQIDPNDGSDSSDEQTDSYSSESQPEASP
ncbi:MAG: M56 family metallopeptidase [Pirellulales bacterium]|nr:M56 family metallopeptidase [Pirellulales bacterium]